VRALACALLGLAFALGVVVSDAAAVRPVDEAILPVEDYKLPEVRALAQAHGDELVALYQDVRRCAPELDFQLDGIAFQRPRQAAQQSPHLTLWVFLDARRPLAGPSPAARAAEAVRQYGRKMVRRLSARGPVAADTGVGGYGLVLSWTGPKKIKDQAVMESLAVFSRKGPAVAFAAGQATLRDFLQSADVRLFDGQEELPFPVLTSPDPPGPAGLGAC
jgi:hypothetical protein